MKSAEARAMAEAQRLNAENRERLLQMEAEISGSKWNDLRTFAEQYASEQSPYNPETDT